eukprot:g36338.t1
MSAWLRNIGINGRLSDIWKGKSKSGFYIGHLYSKYFDVFCSSCYNIIATTSGVQTYPCKETTLDLCVELEEHSRSSSIRGSGKLTFWAWTLRQEGFIKLEMVKKRFTRMLPGMEGLSYKERLGLFSLECRRLRVDLIEFYKILRGI